MWITLSHGMARIEVTILSHSRAIIGTTILSCGKARNQRPLLYLVAGLDLKIRCHYIFYSVARPKTRDHYFISWWDHKPEHNIILFLEVF